MTSTVKQHKNQYQQPICVLPEEINAIFADYDLCQRKNIFKVKQYYTNHPEISYDERKYKYVSQIFHSIRRIKENGYTDMEEIAYRILKDNTASQAAEKISNLEKNPIQTTRGMVKQIKGEAEPIYNPHRCVETFMGNIEMFVGGIRTSNILNEKYSLTDSEINTIEELIDLLSDIKNSSNK